MMLKRVDDCSYEYDKEFEERLWECDDDCECCKKCGFHDFCFIEREGNVERSACVDLQLLMGLGRPLSKSMRELLRLLVERYVPEMLGEV